MKLVYSPHYDIGLFGLEKLHPFDTRKHSRAWKLIESEFGSKLSSLTVSPDREISHEELLDVHGETYLRHLSTSRYVAEALEIPAVRWLPASILDRAALAPMRWATRGTVLGAEAALSTGFAANLAGGYHHAKPLVGEGFCVYNDIAIAIRTVFDSAGISEVAYIDLDAHMGNGVAICFRKDSRVKHFDMYNEGIYPAHDHVARDRIDCPLPLDSDTAANVYLDKLRINLIPFLNSTSFEFAIFNAGSDVFAGDKLGGLSLTEGDVRTRDDFVLAELKNRRIPTLFLPSGGYSKESHRMIANSLIAAVRRSESE